MFQAQGKDVAWSVCVCVCVCRVYKVCVCECVTRTRTRTRTHTHLFVLYAAQFKASNSPAFCIFVFAHR